MTTQNIYNHIQGLNPKQSEVSSIGSIISASSEMISEYIYKEIISYLPTTSLAYKIKAEKRKAFQNQVNSNLNACMQIGIGEEVIHSMFGEGVVVFSSEEKITVNFYEVGEKNLAPKFAKLTKK